MKIRKIDKYVINFLAFNENSVVISFVLLCRTIKFSIIKSYIENDSLTSPFE